MIREATAHVESVSLADIHIDGETQPRVNINEVVVGEYADEMTTEVEFPPVVVYFDGTNYWLADGFHRYLAARRAGLEKIEASVLKGAREDAQWFSYGANRTHGLRRTNADKQRAVEAALKHHNGASMSDRLIAEHVGVHHETVGKQRAKLVAGGEIATSVSRKRGQDGKSYPASKSKKPKPELGSEERPYPANVDYPGQIDDEQQDVPEELWEVFRHRGDFGELARRCNSLAVELEQLGNADWGECYDAVPDVNAIKDAAESIANARPSVLSEHEDRGWLPVREVE